MRILELKSRVIVLITGLLLVSGFADAGHAQTAKAQFDDSPYVGTYADGKYSNGFFGFEIELPKNWVSLAEEEVATAKNITSESLMASNSNANKAIDSAFRADRPLFLYAMNPMGAIENASIGMNVIKQPSIHVTAKMVIEATKSAYLKNPNTKIITDTRTELIGGKEFHNIEFEVDMLGQRVPLRYYVLVHKGYSLTVSLSSVDTEIMEKLETSFRTIKFSVKK